jgi:hypothetical protein
MARILGFVALVLVVTAALSFAVLNARPVPVNFYFGTRDLPLALALVLALVAGEEPTPTNTVVVNPIRIKFSVISTTGGRRITGNRPPDIFSYFLFK